MEFEAIRNETEANVLRVLAREGAQSRADLARKLGVMRSTVGTQVNRMFGRGLIRIAKTADAERGRQGIGRPGEAVELDPAYCSFIGVDFGVGHLRVILTDMQCNPLRQTSLRIPPEEQVPAHMCALIVEQIRDLARGRVDIAGISISVPGIVTREGVVVRLPLLGWRDVPLREMLEQALGEHANITLDNDANIFARGELIRKTVTAESAVYLWLDSGIGAGIAFDGRLLSGSSGRAGEVGHIFVSSGDQGQPVRLDDVVGKIAILRRHAALGGSAANFAEFVEAIMAGAAPAAEVMETWISVMGAALSTLTSLFDPEAFILSGPLTEALAPVEAELDAALSAHLLHGTRKPELLLLRHRQDMLAENCAYIMRSDFLQKSEKA